jgi:uncharacterized protein YndB with AHSA1/START domain
MTVVSTTKDTDTMKLVFVAEFDAPPERVWQVWEDPRLLERWWGPPGYPATFVRHEFCAEGQSRYFMTAPDGKKSHGFWRIVEIDEPHSLEIDNGLAGADGEPDPNLPPGRASVTFEPVEGKTRMTVTNQFLSIEQMETMLGMGMAEGMAMALGQIDGLLSGSSDGYSTTETTARKQPA